MGAGPGGCLAACPCALRWSARGAPACGWSAPDRAGRCALPGRHAGLLGGGGVSHLASRRPACRLGVPGTGHHPDLERVHRHVCRVRTRAAGPGGERPVDRHLQRHQLRLVVPLPCPRPPIHPGCPAAVAGPPGTDRRLGRGLPSCRLVAFHSSRAPVRRSRQPVGGRGNRRTDRGGGRRLGDRSRTLPACLGLRSGGGLSPGQGRSPPAVAVAGGRSDPAGAGRDRGLRGVVRGIRCRRRVGVERLRHHPRAGCRPVRGEVPPVRRGADRHRLGRVRDLDRRGRRRLRRHGRGPHQESSLPGRLAAPHHPGHARRDRGRPAGVPVGPPGGRPALQPPPLRRRPAGPGWAPKAAGSRGSPGRGDRGSAPARALPGRRWLGHFGRPGRRARSGGGRCPAAGGGQRADRVRSGVLRSAGRGGCRSGGLGGDRQPRAAGGTRQAGGADHRVAGPAGRRASGGTAADGARPARRGPAADPRDRPPAPFRPRQRRRHRTASRGRPGDHRSRPDGAGAARPSRRAATGRSGRRWSARGDRRTGRPVTGADEARCGRPTVRGFGGERSLVRHRRGGLERSQACRRRRGGDPGLSRPVAAAGRRTR